MSNNQEECYSLLKACQIAKEVRFQSIQIYGDSELLIKLINLEGHFNNSVLNKILQRIRILMKEFEKVDTFHILRDLNRRADSMANNAFLLAQGYLSLNGKPREFQPIL